MYLMLYENTDDISKSERRAIHRVSRTQEYVLCVTVPVVRQRYVVEPTNAGLKILSGFPMVSIRANEHER
jgi:hypothetical protein